MTSPDLTYFSLYIITHLTYMYSAELRFSFNCIYYIPVNENHLTAGQSGGLMKTWIMRHRMLRNQQESRIIYILVCVPKGNFWRTLGEWKQRYLFWDNTNCLCGRSELFLEWTRLNDQLCQNGIVPFQSATSFVLQFSEFMVHCRQHKNLCQLSNLKIKLHLIPTLVLSTSKVVTFNAHTGRHCYVKFFLCCMHLPSKLTFSISLCAQIKIYSRDAHSYFTQGAGCTGNKSFSILIIV